MSPWTQMVFVRLVDLYVLSAVLLAVTLIVTRWLRSPAQRMAWAWGTTGALCLLVGAVLLPAGWRNTPGEWLARLGRRSTIVVAVEPQPERAPAVSSEPLLLPITTETPLPLSTSMAVSVPKPTPHAWQAVQVTLLAAWGATAVLMFVWLGAGAFRALRLKRRGKVTPDWAQDELRHCAGKHSPRLLASDDLPAPVALGTLRPAILLPTSDVRKDNQPAVRAAIRHEWAHIAGGDLWLHAAQRWLSVLLFAHPLYWLFRRQTRYDQELLADAAAASDDPLAYAEVLLSWARQAARVGFLPALSRSVLAADGCGLAMWREPSSLKRRIEMLVQHESSADARSGRWRQRLAVATVLVLGLALASVTSQSQEQSAADAGKAEIITVTKHPHGSTIYGQDHGGRRLVTISEGPDRLTVRVTESVMGPDLESTYAVRNAADLEKKHREIFAIYRKFMAAAGEPQAELKATTRLEGKFGLPGVVRPAPAMSRTALTAPVAGEVFFVETTISEISHAALAEAEVSLGEIVQEELSGECHLEGNLIYALCLPKDAERLTRQLQKHKSYHILSQPKVATQENNTARVHVGGEIPLLKTVRVLNGEPQQEITYIFEGIQLELTPSRLKLKGTEPSDIEQYQLELSAEVSKRQPKPAAANEPPSVDRRTVQMKAALEPKQVLIIAERSPKGVKNATTLYLQLAVEIAKPDTSPSSRALPNPQADPRPVRAPTATPAELPRATSNDSPARVEVIDIQDLKAENERLKRELKDVQAHQEELLKRLKADVIAGPPNPNVLTNTPAKPAAPPQEVEALNAQLRALEVMEAESVLAAKKSRFDRIQQAHKSGGLSQQELDVAKMDLAVAEIELMRRRAGDDPRAQAEAQLRLAETQAAAAKQDYDRGSEMQKKSNSISAEELDQLKLNLMRAEIALQRARLQLEATIKWSRPKQ